MKEVEIGAWALWGGLLDSLLYIPHPTKLPFVPSSDSSLLLIAPLSTELDHSQKRRGNSFIYSMMNYLLVSLLRKNSRQKQLEGGRVYFALQCKEILFTIAGKGGLHGSYWSHGRHGKEVVSLWDAVGEICVSTTPSEALLFIRTHFPQVPQLSQNTTSGKTVPILEVVQGISHSNTTCGQLEIVFLKTCLRFCIQI